MDFLRNLFGKKQSTDKPSKKAPSQSQKSSKKTSSQKPIKIKKYNYGWIQEFSTVERAGQQFTNFVKFVEENKPSFPFGFYLSAGTIPISAHNKEEQIWLLYLYDMKCQQDATEFIVEFQKSPSYISEDDYMFNSYRQELFYAAVNSGKMKILEKYKFSAKRTPKTLSLAKKAQTAWEMYLLRSSLPPRWKSDLLLALSNEDVVARRFAASALQAFHTRDVANALEIALRDQDPDVRFNAGRSLFKLKGDKARPTLEQMLANETNDYVRNNITALISGQSHK